MAQCNYDSRPGPTNYSECSGFEKIKAFDPYGLVCLHKDSLKNCKHKYAASRQMSEKDRQEIYDFAIQRSNILLKKVSPEPNGENMQLFNLDNFLYSVKFKSTGNYAHNKKKGKKMKNTNKNEVISSNSNIYCSNMAERPEDPYDPDYDLDYQG